ncbi:MAG: beta-lactamase family protein [Thermoanaerobaculales bacterium]|nr:beta-lactamase family protein [Thermoanaerobaculales bacterium]
MMTNRSPVGAFLDAIIRGGKAPGGVAAWNEPDSQTFRYEVSGKAAVIEEGAGSDTEETTWYDLASLTKPLVVTTLFLLARRLKGIDLDTRVGEILADLSKDVFPGDRTLGSLLTHTSGISAWEPFYIHPQDRDDTARFFCRLSPLADVGRQVMYSCPGFILLGRVLEHLFQLDLAEAFIQMVTGPLDLTGELDFRPEPMSVQIAGGSISGNVERLLLQERGLRTHLLPLRRHGQPDDGNARFLGGAAGNSGLFGTAHGVHLLAKEYLPGGGRLLSATEVELATRCRTSGLGQERALGWQLASTRGCSAGAALPPEAFGHIGFTGTSVWVNPLQRQVMVLLTNRHHPEHRMTDLHPLRRRFNALVRF